MKKHDNDNITEIAMGLLADSFLNKMGMAKELGISRPTLDSRLAGVSKWKPLEKWWMLTQWTMLYGMDTDLV